MELEKTLEKINNGRTETEACFVFSLWNNPELYADYLNLNEGTDKTLKNKDARFYFKLGKMMYLQGYRSFDPVSVTTFLSSKPKIEKKFEEYGGIKEVEQLKEMIDANNVDAYFDKLARMNSLSLIAEKYTELFDNVERFDNASNEDVYNVFELLNTSVSIKTGQSERIEELSIDQDFINYCKQGNNMGISYGKGAPLLNYITLGAAKGNLYMIGGHSGSGKSSFVFESMLMPMHQDGAKVAIISNEMNITTYKILLLEHILTNELNYWGLTRKQIKIGQFSSEQLQMIDQAIEIQKQKYTGIYFVKTFDNNISKIIKYMRRLKAQGVSVILYDTFKSDDSVNEKTIWQGLMLDSRKLFQTCSKLDISCITTYQLALHTTNYRFLDVACLSNSKQIKEVYETMVYFRPLWDDEYTGEKYDVKAYRLNRQNNKIKEMIELDKNKKYILLFVDKTRSDEDKQVLIYEWNGRFNHWKELGFAKVINDHRSGTS